MKYKKFIIIYSIILVILMIGSLSYVYISLMSYESNQPEKYIKNLVNKIKANPKKYVDIKEEYVDGYKDILKLSKVTIEEMGNNYEVLVDGSPIFNVELEKGKSFTKLGLLNYNELSLKKISTTSDKGVYYYKVKIPSSFTLKSNGKTINKVIDKNVNEEFEEINNELYPMDYIYEVSEPKSKPVIEILNNDNKKVNYEKIDGLLVSHEFMKTNNYKDVIRDPIDVMAFAEKWSLFLTNDLKNGWNTIKPYLIKDNKMYKFANDWANGVDKGMVSKHTLKNPTFTNKSVSDCIIYNENSFSCLVKLDKNMIVAGKDKIDSLNDRMYFAYDTSWKLVDFRYVGE